MGDWSRVSAETTKSYIHCTRAKTEKIYEKIKKIHGVEAYVRTVCKSLLQVIQKEKLYFPDVGNFFR